MYGMRSCSHGLHARQELTELQNAQKAKKAAYLINGDADPNASSRVVSFFSGEMRPFLHVILLKISLEVRPFSRARFG